MNNEVKNQKSFSENLLELNDFYEENKTLTKLLFENFDTLESQISKHKGVKNIAKNKNKEIQIEKSFYVNLAKILKNSEEFYGQDINPSTLASIMSRIRDKKGLSKNRTNKSVSESSTPLQAVVSTQVAVTQQQPVKFERPQKQEEDESSSVVVEKIDLENESQPVSRVGDLSTGQVSQAQNEKFLITKEDEEILLNYKNVYFAYVKFIDKLDKDIKVQKEFGLFEEEQKMEKLVQAVFKVFEIEYYNGNYNILSDASLRSNKLKLLNVSDKIKKELKQIWSRMDLINMLIERKKRANTPG